MTQYVLPDLPYDYGALQPHISGEIMELHHDKHHRAYVEGANRAVEQMIEARRREDFSEIAAIQRALAFNVSGHVLHSIFWRNLTPQGGDRPTGVLAGAIERDFGGFERFQKQLLKVAMTIMGSGWAALVWDPVSARLGTTQIHDHQSEITQCEVPLLVIDAWEHAYYLQYRTHKIEYFAALFQLWNWQDIEVRFARAMRVDLALTDTAGSEQTMASDEGSPVPVAPL